MGKLDHAWQAFQPESFNVLNADIEILLLCIGAHAAIERRALLAYDAARYRSYSPKVELLAP